MIDKKYDVVIIDSGAEPFTEEEGVHFYVDDNDIIIHGDDFFDDIGHGTAVQNIIKLHNSNVKCFHIRIFDSKNAQIHEKLLVHALEYIYTNIECKLINMSLGITVSMSYFELYDICNRLKNKGVILVSAFDNAEVMSYPAAFDNVIGVATSPSCKKITEIEIIDHSTVNVCAKGCIQRVKWVSPKYIFTQGNSYACAHVSGILSNSSCRSLEEAHEYLENIAQKKYTHSGVTETLEKPNFLENSRAVLFPFNKEMHSIIRFPNMLHVKIIDIYDVRQSARVNASVNKLLNISNTVDYRIKNIENINWDTFETLIIGHTDELNHLINNSRGVLDLILEAYDRGKNIYCFDDIEDIVKEHSLSHKRVYYPKTVIKNINHIPLGMLYRPWIPMLGIFGTTSKQGKFTLQLIMREKFLRDNYKVGQIGTEPSSYLFDMDLCFHFGYRSTSDVMREEMVSYLNSSIDEISKKGVDIIISGCQSGTVPYDFGNIKYYTFWQTEFLLGTLPDAVILCVNAHDEFEYVKRTIGFIESSVDSKVVAIVIYPMGFNEKIGKSRLVRLDDVELTKSLLRYKSYFNLPTYILGDDVGMENLYNTICEFFADDAKGEEI